MNKSALVVAVVITLAGCVSQPAVEMCFVRMVGITSEGLSVTQQMCMTPEQFAAETQVVVE